MDADTKPTPEPHQPKGLPQLVSRLMGMETEYATLVMNHPDLPTADLPASSKIYARICAAIRRAQPTVPGVMDQDQMFLASGGAVTFESHPSLHALPGGLVEIATPEVNSPDELLACQRSIDQMVAEAASEAAEDVDLRVLKNSSDALGHVYGCQENYETIVASGLWLIVYRCFIAVLWAMQFLSFVLVLPLLAITFSLIILLRFRREHFDLFRIHRSLPATSLSAGELFDTLPSWTRGTLILMLRAVHYPTVLVLRFVVRHVAFRPQRKYLTALLVSRVSLCGTGDLDHDGCYRLSAKAMAIDSFADMGSYNGERPIYVFGHWLGQMCATSFLSLSSTKALFARRQRLQIGLSDSNLSESAEYVKVASVSLILDMIESGETQDFVTLRRPIDALHDITSDWNLVRRVSTSVGLLSALEIQRRYLKAARRFVASTPPERRGESERVLQQWTQLSDVVRAFRRDARNVTPSLGRVDWLTKRWMIDQLGGNATWLSRKKMDLRYHELSADGYFQKLVASNPSLRLVGQDRIEQRRRNPPLGSPATRRSRLIREFGGTGGSVAAEWRYAILGTGKSKKRIDF